MPNYSLIKKDQFFPIFEPNRQNKNLVASISKEARFLSSFGQIGQLKICRPVAVKKTKFKEFGQKKKKGQMAGLEVTLRFFWSINSAAERYIRRISIPLNLGSLEDHIQGRI